MYTISADQIAKIKEAAIELDIFAVQFWYEGLIQSWIFW